MLFTRLLISILALAAAAVPASGTVTIYCNQVSNCGSNNSTAFSNATSTLFFGSGFQNLTAANGTYSSGLMDANSITGLNFFGYSGTTQIGVKVASGALQQISGGPSTSLQAQLPTNMVYAFAGNISVVSGSGSPCIETISSVSAFGAGNCNTSLAISSSSDVEFFGVVSDVPLTSVFVGYLAGGNPGALALQNFERGEQAQTPELATMVLIGSGLIFLGVLRRRGAAPHGRYRQE